MMKNKLFRNILLAIFMTAMSAACLPTQEQEDTAAPPLRVGFTNKWGDFTLLVAKDKGFFKQHGVEVDPAYYKLYSEYTIALASGQLDGSSLAMGDIININPITPLKVVGLSDDGGAEYIVAGPGINSIRDLEGKKVGVLLGTQYELMVAEMLRSAGMSSSDIDIVSTNPEEALAALKDGRVQAVYMWEPYLSQALDNGNKTIYPTETTRFFPDTIVFRASIIKQRPEDIRAFLLAWYEAATYRAENEEETREIAAKYLGVSVESLKADKNLKIYSLREAKTLFSIQEKNSIYDVTRITSDYLISIGTITQGIDLLTLIDPSYMP
jgi:NitT/TauT family transport system substrate-binding protein